VSDEEKSYLKMIYPHCVLIKSYVKKQANATHTQDFQVNKPKLVTWNS